VDIVVFCASSNGNANQPGAAQRQVRLNHVKPPAPTPAVAATATAPAVPASQAPGANDALFDAPTGGDININLSGVNAATKTFFEEGALYKVTIEKLPA
jgi:hypothetical protein